MKQAHSAKIALTRAIENEVERMDMAGLLSGNFMFIGHA